MELITFLKTNKNTRKIFGKKEIKIIEKQINGINLTQSEKNRLSRDIRKKFDFIKEIFGFNEEFELKKGANIKKIIWDSKNEILNDSSFKNIRTIWLYGSAVENKLMPESDIDIAVDFFNINLKEATLFRKRILGRVNSKADIQVYNVLPDKIKKEIQNIGKRIYSIKNG